MTSHLTTTPTVSVTADAVAVPVSGYSRRDAAIDTIRGICVILMTVSHLADETVASRILHPAPWLDGASGFVLMSGLVLGLVQPSRLRRSGLRGAVVLLLRRALLLYVIHIATVLLAVAAGYLAPSVARFPRVADHGGLLGTVGQAVLLRLNPEDIDILSLYVILLVCAAGVLPLLARGLAWLVVAASATVYVVATAFPLAFTLPIGNGHPSKFDWGTWQLLFLSALVVGWYWKAWNLRQVLTSRPAFLVAAGAWFTVTLVGVLLASAGLVPALAPALHQAYYDKPNQGFGRFLLSWAAFVTIYATMSWAMRRWSLGWLAPVERLGKRSLSAFIVLTVITVLVPLVAGHDVRGPVSMLVAAGALVVMYVYVLLRWRERPAAAPSGSPERVNPG